MKKVLIALVLIVGSLGAMNASADSRFSIGWVFGHHGDVSTHFSISNNHYRHESRHERRHRIERQRRHHNRHWRAERHLNRHYDPHHSDAYYHHIHGFHHFCNHH